MVQETGNSTVLLCVPLGWLLESSSSGQPWKQKKETPPLLEPWRDSAVPPVQVPCFLSKDTKGGRFTWKRKGAGTKVTASQSRAPGLSGKGRGRNKFSLSQAGAQNHYMEGE